MTAADGATDNVATAHNAVTLALAKKELGEHMDGMKEVNKEMRGRPLTVKAYALDDPRAPTAADGSISNIKTVHFVRHGQGFHNLMADTFAADGKEWKQFTRTPENPYCMPEILDAPLTEKGRQQAIQLQPCVRALEHKPELVVFSPNCRALQTGVLAFQSLLPQQQQPSPSSQKVTSVFVAHEMCREQTGVHACDKRRPVSNQRAEFPQVDFSLLTSEEDPLHREDARESKLEVGERIYQFLQWLAQRPERHVAVNSHSGWLLCLFNGVVDDECDPKLKEWFQTGEMRSVQLEFILQK